MPTGTQTHQSPAYTARTISADSPTTLNSPYAAAYSAADLSAFPSGGVKNTNTIEELRKNLNQLASDFNTAIVSHQSQITKNDGDISEIDVNLTEHAEDLSAIATDLSNKAWDTIIITAGTGLSGGGNLQADRTIDLLTAKDNEIGGLLSNTAQIFGADGFDTSNASNAKLGPLDIDPGTGQVEIKDYSIELGVKTYGNYVKTLAGASGGNITVTNGVVNNGGAAEVGLTSLITAATKGAISDEEENLAYTHTSGKIRKVLVPQITYNQYGQLTAVSELQVNSANNKLVTITAGDHLTNGGNFFLNNGVNQTVTLNHAAVNVQSDQTFTSSSPASSEVGHREVEILSNIGFDAYGHVDSISKQNLTYGLNSPLSSGYTGSGSFDMQIPRESDFQDLRTLFQQLQGDTISLGAIGNTVIVDRKFDFRKDVLISAGADLNVDDDTLFVDASNDRVGINLGTGVIPNSTLHVGGIIRGSGDFISDSVGTNGDPGSQNARFNGYGIQGHRDEAFYMSNAGTGPLKFGIGGIHNAATKMTLDNNGELSVAGAIQGVGEIRVKGTSPMFKIWDTSSSPAGGDSYNQTTLATGNDHTFEIQTRDGDGTFVSNDYRITKNSSGAAIHQFRVGNTNKLSINNTQVNITTSLDVTGGVGIGGSTTLGNAVGDTTIVSGDFTAGNSGAGNANKLFFDTSNGRFAVGNGTAATSYDVGFKNADIYINDSKIGNFATSNRHLLLKSGIISPTEEGANIDLYSYDHGTTAKRKNAYYNAAAHIFSDPDESNALLTANTTNSFVGINTATADANETLDGRTYGPYKFQVDGDAKLKGNVNITGNLNVTGISSTGSSATVEFNQVSLDEVGGISMNGIFTNALTTDATSSTAGGANTLSGGLAVAKKLYVGGLIHTNGNIFANGTLSLNGNATIGNAETDLHTITGNTTIRGNLIVGSSTDADENLIRFNGVTDDTNIQHTVIAERSYSGGKSELLLFKGNDQGSNVGPDRIRYRAAAHVFQTYNDSPETYDQLEDNSDRVVINNAGQLLVGGHTTSLHNQAGIQLSDSSLARIMLADTSASNQHAFIDKIGEQLGLTSQDGTSHGTLALKSYNGTNTLTRLFIANDGDVGIGNVAPGYKLDVSGAARFRGDVISDTASGAQFTASYGSGKVMRMFHGSSYGVVGTTGNTKVAIRTNDTDRLTVLTDGKVGIGTITPAEALHVDGTIRIEGSQGIWDAVGDSGDQLLRKEFLQFPRIDSQTSTGGSDGARLYAENSIDGSATTTNNGSLVLEINDDSTRDSFLVRHTAGGNFRNLLSTTYSSLGLIARTVQAKADNDGVYESGTSAATDYAFDMSPTKLNLFKTDGDGDITSNTSTPGLNNTLMGFSFNANSGSPFFMFSRNNNACGGFNVNNDSQVLDFYRSGAMQSAITVGTGATSIFSIKTRRTSNSGRHDRYRITRDGQNVFENALYISGNASTMDMTPDAVLSLKSTKSGSTQVGDHIRFETSAGGALHAIKAGSSGFEIRTTASSTAAKNIKLQPAGSTTAQFNSSDIVFSKNVKLDSNSDLIIDTNGMVYDQSAGRLGIGTASPSGHFHQGGTGIDIVAPDTEVAEIRLRGGSQGSGRIFVGQGTSHGGGFHYNGDDNPSMVGDGDDITFFRKSSSTTQIAGVSSPDETANGTNGGEHRVFHYNHNSNHVRFQGTVTNEIKTTTANGAFTVYLGDSNVHIINVTANSTMTLAKSGRDAGGAFTMIIKNTGNYDIDFPSNMYFAGGDPTLTPGTDTSDGVDILSGVYDGTNFYSAITYDLKPS